ncbi:MAG: hypothetical protein QXI91_04620 [Candidatus Bathyarchaeia archaeon]
METKRKKGEIEKLVYNKRLTYAVVAILIMLFLAFSYFFLFHPNQPSEPKAAIIDQLSSSQLFQGTRCVNETFVGYAKTLLYQRFSSVDYYSDNATVEQYTKLASLNYKLIIWRAHSALDQNNYIAICSSERYVSGMYEQYSSEQLKLCNITGDPFLYFAITPKFIKECMSGRFEDTVIILMSCNGLKTGYTKTAEAFIEKGVKAFISWDGWIDKFDNDNGIALLLDYLINQNNTIAEAVRKIPEYFTDLGKSRLDYYPHSSAVENYHIPNYKLQPNVYGAGFLSVAVSKKLNHGKVKFGWAGLVF